MSTMRSTILLSVLVLGWSGMVYAGELEKRSRVELRVGLWNQGGKHEATAQAGPFEVETAAETGGMLVSLAYAYWMQENLAVHFTLGVLAVEASSRVGPGGLNQQVGVIYPVMLGIRYYLPGSTLQTPFRPFLTVGIGPNIGVEAKNEVGLQVSIGPNTGEVSLQVAQQSRTMTSFGSHVGGGLDVRLGRSFMAGVNVGYNLMTDFSRALGGRRNYSGLEFSAGVSWLFGKRVE